MPEDLGEIYVWVNVPEFLVRVVKDGAVLHTERMIAGDTISLNERRNSLNELGARAGASCDVCTTGLRPALPRFGLDRHS